ncbi:MAG: DNA methyltransferase [Thermotogota bacterium]|nr:DNA methyltransferase [Thermotogota bacterium]
MTKEREFYKALRDIFIGAKVEGESGYINLMRIKSRYYEKGIFPKLQKDIEQALEPFPEFREELFEKLYTFFHRYFSESGSIYFRHTPIHQNVYEQVYTDDKDVILFWKTHMLYYVKTDRLFKNLEAEIDGFKFFFDVSTLEHKRANEKREIVYRFKERRNDGVLAFNVYYSEKGKKTRADEILKALRKEGIRLSQDALENAFRVFERQSEVDYFINQNAREFLKEQFDIWLCQYVFSGESQWTEERIKQLQVLKDTASKIIDFISQFEDELVRIWNKPKFVLNSNYVITLDRVAQTSIELIKRILHHPNFDEQVKEWKDLGIVESTLDPFVILSDSEESINPKYQYLPIDTKYFKDLELEILGLFDDLDNELDGWLIKSENYQALNTILSKFKERVQTIYIDPPFNTGTDFLFEDKFQDSTWLTLLANRLEIAKKSLTATGTISLHLDWNANYIGRYLLDEMFGKDNFLNEIVWRIGWVSGYKTAIERYIRNHDTILFYAAKNRVASFFDKACAKVPYSSFPKNTIQSELSSILQKWKVSESIKNTKIVFKDEMGKVYKLGLQQKDGAYPIEDTWNCSDYEELHSNKIKRNAKEYTPNGAEVSQKPEQLLRRIIELSTKKTDLVLDFFLGSGTSIAVAHKLGRRWVGIEMASYFKTDALYRMKHVLAGKGKHEPCGISKAVNWQGGGFFKYYELEQYEDTLRKVRYEDSDLFENPYEDPYSEYVFMRDIKMLEALEIDYENNKVKVDLSKLYEHIDVPETLSNLCGKWIKKIAPTLVEFEDGEIIDTENLDYKLIKPLIWW